MDPRKAAGAAAAGAVVVAGAAAGAKIARSRGGSRAYRLEPGAPLAQELRRVALGRIDHAIDELTGKRGSTPDEAVHEARKDIKRLRSILRLARGELGNKLYRSENRTFRDTARSLSGVRDAHVAIATFDGLDVPDSAAAKAFRDELVKRREALGPEGGGREDAGEAVSSLRAARARVKEWPLESEDFDAVEPGLRRAYRRGRRCFRTAAEDPTVEHLHEWRKRVKDLWYHQQLLASINPEAMEPAADGAHHLSNLLGDDHDLAVLAAAVDELALPEVRPGLHKAIDRRRNELQAEAFKLGRRIYENKPRAFTERLQRWFEQSGQSP